MSEKNSNDSDDLKDKAASEDAVGREEIDSGNERETRAAAGTESAGRKKLPQLPPRARRFCAFLVGVVFFMSGALKLMDPVGTGLIMEEYFKFLHVGFLSFAAKSSGTLLAFIETMSGVALITGVWRRFTACVVSVFMGLFTLLTLLLLIFNPSMDCGCFGEAVHLTHPQSFLKNVILDVLIFAAFWPFKSFGRNKRRKYVAFSLVSVAVVALMLYSLLYIPLIDFTDFKPGVRLAAADVRSHGGGDDAYEAVFIYEKDGERETFTLDNLPDSTWTYVSTETRTRNASADELMPALSFSDAAGEYHDELAVHKDVMIVSMFRPSSPAFRDFTPRMLHHGRLLDAQKFLHDGVLVDGDGLVSVDGEVAPAAAEALNDVIKPCHHVYHFQVGRACKVITAVFISFHEAAVVI